MLPEPLIDGFVTLDGGVHDTLYPDLLQANQYSRGLNIQLRGGKMRTRPKFASIMSEAGVRVYGYGVWSLNAGDRLVLAIEGKIQIVELDTGVVTELDGFPSGSTTVFMVQADKFMVLQDGINTPLVLQDEAGVISFYPLVGDDVLKAGTVMAYGHGRIFYVPNVVPGSAESGKRFWVASDVILPTNPARVLGMTENIYLNEGGAMGLPGELGFIKAIAFMRSSESGTGVGAMILFARHGCGAASVNVSRTVWKDQDITQVLFFDVDMDSPFSIVYANDDILYRAGDGWRSLRYTISQSNAQGGLSNVPQSGEWAGELEKETKAGIELASGAFANNRLLVTSGAYETGEFGTVYRYLMSADYAMTFGLRNIQPPAWDSLWSGPKIRCVFAARYQGKREALVLGYDTSNRLNIFRLVDSETDHGGKRVRQVLHTGAFSAKMPAETKSLQHLDVWVRRLRGETDLAVYYRADGYPYWSPMGSIKFKATGVEQVRRIVRFTPQAVAMGDPATGEILRHGTNFQFAFVVDGEIMIEKCRGHFDPVALKPCNMAVQDESEAIELTPSSTTGYEIDETYEV